MDTMTEPTIEQLVSAARGGDRGAFETLVSRHREPLRRSLHARLGAALRARVDVEDLLQETLLRALRSLDSFECRGEASFGHWLGGIANHVIHEAARREKRELILPEDLPVPSDAPTQSRVGQREERFDRLQQALDRLSEDHRTVILLARIERLPMKEVARRMHRSSEAATQLLWRALKKLKETFGSTDSFHLPDRRLKPAEPNHEAEPDEPR